MSASPAWSHHNPVRIVAAPIMQLKQHMAGSRPLLVTTKGFVRRGMADLFRAWFGGKLMVWDGVKPNPDVSDLESATSAFHGKQIDQIIGLGGGSAIDAAKVLAMTLANPKSQGLLSLLRQQKELSGLRALPLIAIPTTAGTGAEVTPFATVWDHQGRHKYSLAGDCVYPEVAFLDAKLSLSLDLDCTLFPALDGISHALESLWNKDRNPISESYALQSLVLATRALPRVLAAPNSLDDRRLQQEASVLAGMAISQTRTAIAHAISYPLTLNFAVPHGLACSFCLPELIKLHRARTLDPYEAQVISGIANLLDKLNLATLTRRYVTRDEVLGELGNMFAPERAANCSFPVDHDVVRRLLEQSLSE